SHPSWLWSSLLHGHDLLLQGVRWQVGNERSISFWTQKWVPFSDDFYIRSPLGPFHNRNTVSDFIEDGHWNVRKLREHISATEAEMVLQILILQTGSSDKLIWHFDPKGQHTVKSGYKQAIALRSTPVSMGESSANPSSEFWKISSAAFGIVARDSISLLRYVIAISLSSLDMSPPWSLAALVEDIRIWAKNMHIRFSWVNRESNQVAHWVARNAFSSTLGFSWDVSFLDNLTSLSRSDLYGS
ncbi:reverse transcriptase, partial [Tanacetum coccineum]